MTFLINISITNRNNANYTYNSTENYIYELWREKDWFTLNRIALVNPHWLKYPPPSTENLNFLAVLYIIIMTAGLLGNILVIFMFIRCRSLHSPANILVTNLAFSDLIMMMKMPLFIYHAVNNGLPLGVTACKIYGFVGGLSGTVSISTLSCIALDRYYVVVYPLHRRVTSLRSKICIVISWIYGIIFASLPLLHTVFGKYVPEGYLISCSFEYISSDNNIRYFILSYFVAAWLIPFIVITICYLKIIQVVNQAKNIGNNMQDPSVSSRHCKELDQKKKEIRLALVVLATIGLWFIAWTPYAIVALLGIFGQKQLITPLTSMIPALFCKTASCVDPFIYAMTNQKFKEELKTLFCKQCINKRQIKNVWSTNISQKPTTHSLNSENEIEEIIITTEASELYCNASIEAKIINKPNIVFKNIENCSMQPINNINGNNLSDRGKKYRTSWILRPNFSNRSSSLRNIARSWNKSSKQSSIEETEFT